MSHNNFWKKKLAEILHLKKEHHSKKDKYTSFRTQQLRSDDLYLCFYQLRALGYQPAPDGLRSTHIQALVNYWIGKIDLKYDFLTHNYREHLRPLKPATIVMRLSHLRVFSEWINKRGLVLPPERYVDDPALVTRNYIAQKDKSWTQQNIDVAAIIEAIAKDDIHVAMQLEFCWRFGARVKEAIMCRPHEAEQEGYLLLHATENPDIYIQIKRGTKGGRERFVALDTPEKKACLERAKQFARFKQNHLGRPGLSLLQSYKRFYNVLAKHGVTLSGMGVTAHGLRHEYANDRYSKFAGKESPVRDGGDVEPAIDEASRLKVAKELGHGRSQITNAYLGSRFNLGKAGPKVPKDPEDPENPEDPEVTV
jgi:integrase